jgi:putative tricarboxylic transport membrane protein
MFVFFSEGTGLKLLSAILLLSLIGIGVAVRHSGKKKYLGNILLPCALIALSILFFAITFSFPKEEVGPAAIPHLWIFWTVLLCSWLLYQTILAKGEPDPESGRIGFLLLIMVLLVTYYFAIQILGYFLSTFLFLVLLMHILSYKKKMVIILVTGGWVVFSYLVFYKLLFIQLPLGYFEYFF